MGKGTFGKVKLATHTLTGEKVSCIFLFLNNISQVAVKILEKDKIKDKKDVERITREIKILKKVRHPNIIQLYEVRPLLFPFTHLFRLLRPRVSSSSSWSSAQQESSSTISWRIKGYRKNKLASSIKSCSQVSITFIRVAFATET